MDVEFIEDALRQYAAALESGELDGAGRYLPEDIIEQADDLNEEVGGLTFARLREANVERCETAFHALDHWNPMEWGAACAGEVGEGINAAKKLRRVEDSEHYKRTLPTTDVTPQDVADEIADAVIYADLWAASMGVDLGAAVMDKFNRTSDKVRSGIKLLGVPRGT